MVKSGSFESCIIPKIPNQIMVFFFLNLKKNVRKKNKKGKWNHQPLPPPPSSKIETISSSPVGQDLYPGGKELKTKEESSLKRTGTVDNLQVLFIYLL